MTARSIAFAAPTTRPVRAAVLWMALLVALASSLLSSGFPRTTALGSAFNPATTSVVLKPIRPAPRIVADTARRDDGPAAGASGIAASSVVPVAIVSPAWNGSAHAVAPEPLPLDPHSVLDGSPRGPPLA
ncbi:hypothetical protein [Sphingomonas sp.]